MITSKTIRRSVCSLSCSVVLFAGCAQAPVSTQNGWFSWFRSKPLSEREIQRQEQRQVSKSLQDPAHLHLKYAQWREQVGDLADARQSYQSALKENPKSLEAKLGLARLDQLAGRTEEAEAGFQKVLKSQPGDPQALNAMGQFYASEKLWNKALPLLEEAAEAAPNELSYRYHLAVATAQSGDMDGAFPHFRQAVGEAEAHYNIAYLLNEKGHPDLATHRLKRAMALNPNLKPAKMLLDDINGSTPETIVAVMPKPTPKPQFQSMTKPPVIQRTAAATPAPAYSQYNSAPTQPIDVEHVQQSPVVPAHWARVDHGLGQPPMQALSAPQETQPVPTANWQKHAGTQPTQPVEDASEFLPPYRPNAIAPAGSASGMTTPPITPAQREQWENQRKAAGL